MDHISSTFHHSPTIKCIKSYVQMLSHLCEADASVRCHEIILHFTVMLPVRWFDRNICQLINSNIYFYFISVLSPKVIGIAIARYDFCARDMRELSLLKGDVVKIYTKMSANGWWRGEVNGRVCFFSFSHFEWHFEKQKQKPATIGKKKKKKTNFPT